MKSIIFDVDTGIDDALAMAYAVNSPELDIIGFTSCYGNVSVGEATRNTLAVLEKLGKFIPVYKGADKPLQRETKEDFAKGVHGKDGLGNALEREPDSKAENISAIDFIISQVKEKPHEITIIAVGPLTNIALAIQKAPEIVPLVKEVIIMGGAVRVPGNVTPYGEANIVSDPEAANIVLSSGLSVTLVGLDVTMQTLLPISKLAPWRDSGNKVGQFYAEMTEYYIGAYESFYPGIGGCALHDPLAVGVAINPDLVQTELMGIKVVTEGEETGNTVGYEVENPTVRVCTRVQADQFLQHFLQRIETSWEYK
ncbi:nucleoside hydrolase [Fredinandcohnia humi]